MIRQSSRTPSPCWSLRPILSCHCRDSFSDTRKSPGIRRNYYDASLVFPKKLSLFFYFLLFFFFINIFFLPFFEWSLVRKVYASFCSFSVFPLLEGGASTLVRPGVSHAFHGRHDRFTACHTLRARNPAPHLVYSRNLLFMLYLKFYCPGPKPPGRCFFDTQG